MRFYRIYIELTNVCGLKCSFCPTKDFSDGTMTLSFFEEVVKQAKTYTNEIACHVFGDPLTLSNLSDYLDIIEKYDMKALLTTSGYFMRKHGYATLFHPCVKQINISLNAYNRNDTSISFEQYINPIIDFCKAKDDYSRDIFINLRIWNLDDEMSEADYNRKVFAKLESVFGIKINISDILDKKSKNIRLAYKTLLHFDNYFEWPSLDNRVYGHGTCQGLNSHIAILSSGIVVPCCLDSHGKIPLGSLHKQTLSNILESRRATDMIDGFSKSLCSEELCLRCSYKDRFN